jgi:glycosyltransferase involved in cell wall biosynthesis
MKHVSEKLVEYYKDEVEVVTTNSMYGPEASIYKKIEPAVENINQVAIKRMPFARWHYPIIDFAGKVYGKIFKKYLPYSITKFRWGIDSSAMNKYLEESTAEVIMATTIIYNFSDYPTWRFKKKNPKPFVLYGAIHLHNSLDANHPFIQRAKACDCYIANTDFEKDELVNYGVDKSKIVSIGTGIALEDYTVEASEVLSFKKKYLIKETDVVIGYIGRLVKGKGVAILINAFRKLYKDNKNIKLLLGGGTTDYVPEIKQIINEENLPIILIENFAEEQKKILYNVLDVFVLASQSESFGVVFLEAWACKKPVIGSRMGAIQSLLSGGIDSLLFEPKSVDSLCETIKELVSDPGKRKQFGENGYRKVAENYTWPTIVFKYREAYKLAIENFNRLKSA